MEHRRTTFLADDDTSFYPFAEAPSPTVRESNRRHDHGRGVATAVGTADGLQVDAEFARSTIAALRQRIVSGENGSMNGMPFALRSGFPSRRTR